MPNPRKPKAVPACPPPERRVTLCVIGAAHGVRGELRVKTFTADPLAIADYGPLFAADGRLFEILDGRLLKDDMIVARFAGVTSREAAQALTNTDLFVDRDSLPEPDDADEFYHTDLIGLPVVAEDGAIIGVLAAIHDFGGGDILEIRPAIGGPTWLQPFTKAAVPLIDMAGKRIVIDPAFLTKPEVRKVDPEAPPGLEG